MFALPLYGNAQHIVQKNETLGGIAKRYGVSVSALQAINGISNPNLLFVGKKLKIPDGNLQKSPTLFAKEIAWAQSLRNLGSSNLP